MVQNSVFNEPDKQNSVDEEHERKSCRSKTSVQSQKSGEESSTCRRPKSSSNSEIPRSKRLTRLRSKTAEGERNKQYLSKSDFSRPTSRKSDEKYDKEDTSSRKSNNTISLHEKSVHHSTKNKLDRGNNHRNSRESLIHQPRIGESWDKSNQKRRSDGSKTLKQKPRSLKRPSEIPKLKTIMKGPPKQTSVDPGNQSKLPIKMKEVEKPVEARGIPQSLKMALKSYRVRREAKVDEKIKESMKDDFGFLVPMYEKEFRRITEVWVNTLYCSLSMRKNLIKLLHDALPQVNKGQFEAEDENIHKYIMQAKNHTKGEADTLLHLIKTIQGNREKLKEQYTSGMTNREIAKLYNHDWKFLSQKISNLMEETRQLQLDVPELKKKKEHCETTHGHRIRDIEMNIEKKDSQIQKLSSQLAALKEKESSYRKNVFLKIQDYKDMQADIVSLKSMEKEFQDVKTKFTTTKDMYEKKIKDLESLLEEKKRILDREKEVKQKLQVFMSHMQNLSVGKEEVDYVLGRPHHSKEKRREQLWLAAVKLVLKGFLIQMKKLERDRNKMLLEIQSNDPENFGVLATSLIKRDNFIKTIKHQMNDFEKAYKSTARAVKNGPTGEGETAAAS